MPQRREALPTAEFGQLDDEAAFDHLAAGSLDQLYRRLGGAAGRDQEAMIEAGRDIKAWLASGSPMHPQHHAFPLDRLADAHVAVEEGAIGKVIVEVGA
jgi:hypothetical protein